MHTPAVRALPAPCLLLRLTLLHLQLAEARALLSSDDGTGSSHIDTSTQPAATSDTMAQPVELTASKNNEVALNARPHETAPTVNAAAQEAATAVAPLGLASLIALPHGQTTPNKDLSVLDFARHRQHMTAPRRPLKGSSLLGKGEQFERSASDDTPPAFFNDSSPAEGQPPAKKLRKKDDSTTTLEPTVQMTSALKQVMDNADEVAAAKASMLSEAAMSSQVAVEQ
jgi:hypothetical protein